MSYNFTKEQLDKISAALVATFNTDEGMPHFCLLLFGDKVNPKSQVISNIDRDILADVIEIASKDLRSPKLEHIGGYKVTRDGAK